MPQCSPSHRARPSQSLGIHPSKRPINAISRSVTIRTSSRAIRLLNKTDRTAPEGPATIVCVWLSRKRTHTPIRKTAETILRDGRRRPNRRAGDVPTETRTVGHSVGTSRRTKPRTNLRKSCTETRGSIMFAMRPATQGRRASGRCSHRNVGTSALDSGLVEACSAVPGGAARLRGLVSTTLG